MPGRWRDRDEHALTPAALAALFNNEIPCIRVTGFATPAECQAFVRAMDTVGLNKEYRAIGPNVRFRPRYIGVPQFEYRKRPKADYFATVEEAYADQAKVFEACGFDPIARLTDLLRGAAPGKDVRIAQEPGHGRYYAGIIRDITGGTNLHLDFARFTAPDYAIGANDAQIATNFYADGSPDWGETTVYNLHFDPPVARGQYFESAPFDPTRVDGVERTAFKPLPGDLVMFNSRCPHRVGFNPNDDGRRRMGIGSFVGRAPGGNLVLWS
jgi:hypothetical protein